MGRLAHMFRNSVRRLFQRTLARKAQQPKEIILKLETLEDRLVPAGQGAGTLGVAHSVTTAAGTYNLDNSGTLTFTPTGGSAANIDIRVASFNVDASGALWDLEAGGTLWLLN